MARRRRAAGLLGATTLTVVGAVLAAEPARSRPPILEYIKHTWTTLTRTNHNLATAAVDPKHPPLADGRWPVYISANEDRAKLTQSLRREMTPGDFEKIEIRVLPPAGAPITEHGLLYLPKPYVVPGGRFNEMYGWDSYFISMGLLRDGDVELARDMTDNFLYEIREYGMILNANRTYYLTRSQPPFLTEMLLAVYQHTKDRAWLEASIPAIEKYYRYWTSEPHLTPQTGLSRYFDMGEGPAPEVVAAERDGNGVDEYDLVREYFRTHRIDDYDAAQFYDAAHNRLTPLFYKGDRSMRESGFDPSKRFGPFSADIIHYNPVCLNSLLYLMESQAAEIWEIAGRAPEAQAWRARAAERASRVNQLLWDESQGLYADYNFASGQVRRYPFLTTFYPLWVGIASQKQADRVVGNLKLFEQPGGLQTSIVHSGDQWDAPFGWAPLQWIAVQGLRRYGYSKEAERISEKFLTLMLQEYRANGNLMEKYDVVNRRADVAKNLRYGYRSNEAGFGWTNAVFTGLLDELAPADRAKFVSGLSGPRREIRAR
jgi:alpha,alpha-trehalase